MAALPQRRQERLQDIGLAVALAAVNAVSLLPYRASCTRSGWPWCWSSPRPSAGLAPVWPIAVGLVIGAARVAYDQIGFGFAPFPLGPAIAFYTVIDRRGRALALGRLRGGGGGHRRLGGRARAHRALRRHLPGDDLPHRVGGGHAQPDQAGDTCRLRESRADRAEAELDRQAARAAAAERTRIARELHDVVAHHVSLMAVQAEAAASLLPDRPAQAPVGGRIIGETARQALTELRRLLGVLRGPAERLQTAPAASLGELGDVLDQVRGAGLAVDFDVAGTPGPLSPGMDLTAYRIVQEALTNTIRHARRRAAAGDAAL